MSFCPLAQVRAIFIKEGREILRDRRTLLAMVLIPLIAIPGILFLFSLLSLFFLERAREDVIHLGLVGIPAENPEEWRQALGLPGHWELHTADDATARERIRAREWSGAIQLQSPTDLSMEDPEAILPRFQAVLLHYEGDLRSVMTRETVTRALQSWRDTLIREQWIAAGQDPADLDPVAIRTTNVAEDTRVTGALLGGLLPYLVVMLCLTGAAYPAIDLTAGEKERGTLETILTSPVNRNALVLGKFLIVLVVAVITVLCALLSLGGSFTLAGHALRENWITSSSLSFLPSLDRHALWGIFALLSPLAALFSALLLLVALLARSFREAQTYLSPIYLLALLPAMITTLPGVQLSGALVYIPVVNVCLIAREMMLGSYPIWPILVVVVSHVLATMFFLWLTRRLIEKETVLFRY